MSAKSTDSGEVTVAEKQLTRRMMMIGTAGAIASAGMMGSVSASNQEIAWDSDLAPEPMIEGARVEVAEISESMGDLQFVDNDGATRSLAEWGARLRAEAPSGVEDDPNNPVAVRADNIDAETFTEYPRGVEDDNEEPVSALDAANWTTSGMTVSDSGSDLSLDASAAGDSATLDLSAISGVIDSGVERRVLQTVISVSSLGGSGIELSISDSSANSVTETIAGAVGDGIVTQTQLGDLTDSDLLEDISEITITSVGGGSTATLSGFDVERESMLTFGVREATELNDNDEEELITEDVTEPSGFYSITSLSSIGSQLSGRIDDVRFDIEFIASELPTDNVAVEFSDAPSSRSANRQMDLAVEYQLPSGFDLDWMSVGSIMDTGSFPAGNYLSVELLEDAEISEIEDPFDLGDSATALGDEYDIGDEIDISTVAGVDPAPGVGSILHYSVLLSEDQESMLSDAGDGWFGAAGGSSDSGGLLGTLRGFVLMIAGVGGAAVAWLRARGRTLGIGGS